MTLCKMTLFYLMVLWRVWVRRGGVWGLGGETGGEETSGET